MLTETNINFLKSLKSHWMLSHCISVAMYHPNSRIQGRIKVYTKKLLVSKKRLLYSFISYFTVLLKINCILFLLLLYFCFERSCCLWGTRSRFLDLENCYKWLQIILSWLSMDRLLWPFAISETTCQLAIPSFKNQYK